MSVVDRILHEIFKKSSKFDAPEVPRPPENLKEIGSQESEV